MNPDPPPYVDQPAKVIRVGEDLPRETLNHYLRDQLPELSGSLEIRQFPAGYSNLTYLLTFDTTELILRRPPFGNRVQSAHDMSREFRVLSQLSPHYPLAPRVFLYCDDETVIGSSFYIMERRCGIVLRRQLPTGLEVKPNHLQQLATNFANRFAELHSLDYQRLGLTDLGKPQGYIERQVKGWLKRYEAAATHHYPEVEALGKWLANHRPVESDAALIHNDFKFDNLVLAQDNVSQIIAVLDWEMATIGDPLMDLGSTLAYWIEAEDADDLKRWAFAITDQPGCLTRQELAEHYLEARRVQTKDLLFYYNYGLFKLIGIVQQIYARYHRGSTTDQRFAQLHRMVEALGQQAQRTLEQEQISSLQ